MSSTSLNSALDLPCDTAFWTLVLNWSIFLLSGVGVLYGGCLALVFFLPTMLSLAILFSARMLVDGVAAIISAASRPMHGSLRITGVRRLAQIGSVGTFLWPGLLAVAWAIVIGSLMTVGVSVRTSTLVDGGWFWANYHSLPMPRSLLSHR